MMENIIMMDNITMMQDIPSTISFHPSSLFQPLKPSLSPLIPSEPTIGQLSRSSSRESISSIETEFTHFRPIRRHPVTSGRQMVIARPEPVRSTTITTCSPSSDCTLSALSIETDQDREQARIKQEKMDCELAWRIHKQEKKVMLRQTSTLKQSPTRNKAKQVKDENIGGVGKRELKKTSKSEGKTWQGVVKRQQSRRKCRRS
eukprot:TRINITY_DN5922_c0_g1_i2.p1 TRINITY_DN5922_c0_g1~~TRINITY_DN5922_c0_g1_i2.p1  ORF type:complete len:203 (+),score=64.95 TRINITY_DN5922_c0_g1_i2:212-820(+)